MVDLYGADKGNISLPPRLQSPEVHDGEPDDSKEVMILNMQTAFYQIRITDILKRIERLKNRNTEIEDSCIAEKLHRSQVDINTANQIAELNRQIYSEVEKLTEQKKRIRLIQDWIVEEKQAHLKNVECANEKYERTRLEITTKINILNSKINTLEEYKEAKTDLRNKLIAGNDLMAQREKDVEQRCEQIERKFKIGREKLKNEMYARLRGLAGTFQMEVATSMAKPIHRLMRENVFLKNELLDVIRESVPKKEKIKRNNNMDETMTRDCTVSKKSTVEYLIESKIQGHLLNTVKEEHTRVKDFVEKLRQTASDMKMVENTYGITKVRADEMLCRISTLEADLHRQQTQLNIVKHLRDKSEMELQRCTNIFYDTKYVVACALRMNDTGKDILEMGDRQLMLCLFDILNKAVTERWKNRTPSSATVHFPQEAYKIGDLGIKVSHVELRKTRMSRQRKSSRLSTLKILASLGVRLSGTSFSKSKIIPENLENSDEAEEFENSINEEADKSNRESSISLGSQEEDLEQKLITVETVDDEETEVDREDESELEEMKLKPEEQLPDNDDEKQDEFDKNQEIAVKNEKGESTVGTAEAGEASSNQIDVPE